MKEEGVDRVKGPSSSTEGDEDRGFLIQGLVYASAIMNVYNPAQEMNVERFQRVVPYSMEKFHIQDRSI